LDCFFTSNLTDYDNSIIVDSCKKNNIPVFVSLHSGWPDPYKLFGHANKVIVWTFSHKEEVKRKSGIEAEVVGLGRSFISGLKTARQEKNDRTPLNRLRANPDESVILVISNAVHTGLFPVLEINSHLKSLAELFSVPDKLQGVVRLVVKCKPQFDHKKLYARIKKKYDKSDSVTIVDDIPIEHAMDASDMVILANVSTTAYMESVIKKKLTLFIENTPLLYCGQPKIPDGCVYKIANVEDIWPSITKFTENKELSFAEASLQYQNLKNDLPNDCFESKISTILKAI